MYDHILNRTINDDDLPGDMTVVDLAIVLKENRHSFYSLKPFPNDVERFGWGPGEAFRAGDERALPVHGVSVLFATIREQIEKKKGLPNLNDPVIGAVVDKAAKSACDALREAFGEKIDANLEKALTVLVCQMLQGQKPELPELTRKKLEQLAVARPFEEAAPAGLTI